MSIHDSEVPSHPPPGPSAKPPENGRWIRRGVTIGVVLWVLAALAALLFSGPPLLWATMGLRPLGPHA